jgi:hypothetical protein
MPGQRDWLREYEQVTRPAPRPVQRPGQGPTSRPPVSISVRPGTRPVPIPMSRQRPGQGPVARGAWIPEIDFREPTPTHAQGWTQEPNSGWGVAVHDPFERQFFPENLGGTQPRLRPVRATAASVMPQVYEGDVESSSGWYPRGGGGGGGGGWGAAMPESMWWNPGLTMWRYGVRF